MPHFFGDEDHATIDFETKSVLDVTVVGPYRYARHKSTRILCLSFALPWFKPNEVVTWHCGHPDIGISESPRALLKPLFDWIRSGGKVEAHNSFFEEMIWRYVARPRHGWPKIANNKWRDSAAKAASISLPRSLEDAGLALNLPIQKQEGGKALIRRYCQPKRLTKFEKELFGADAIIWNEDVEGLKRFWEYNAQDVRAERRLSNSIPDLSPTELRIWQITCAMNRRGVLIDIDLCHAALEMAAKARDKLNAELLKITGIEKGSQRAAVKDWLEANESLILFDTTAKTLEWFLERFDPDKKKLTPRCRRVLEIVREVNRTSPKKYKAMIDAADENGRVYDLLAYCGAERTGRWSGKGIQVQNLPKGNLPEGFDMDRACADIKTRDFERCEMIYGDVMNLIVSCLRGAIIAPEGRELIVADYAAIEARCVLWLAGADNALKVFEGGGDIYCDMASGIFGRPIVKDAKAQARALAKGIKAEIAKVITTSGKTERDFGKVAILGLGYGMGWIKFLLTLRDYKIYLTRAEVRQMMGAARLAEYEAIVRKKLYPTIADFAKSRDPQKSFTAALRESKIELRRLTDEREDPRQIMHELALCKYTVGVYRSRYEDVPAMWKAQESAAIEAVRTNKPVKCGRVTWFVQGRFLKCRLPSGRCLHYCDAHLKEAKTSWGEMRPSLRFMGRDQKTKRWTRQGTYGGKITENITQATARDIMALAMIELEDAIDYDLLITVHDEAVAEVDQGTAVPEEFEAMMREMPQAFAGCPITAESKRFTRYRKA